MQSIVFSPQNMNWLSVLSFGLFLLAKSQFNPTTDLFHRFRNPLFSLLIPSLSSVLCLIQIQILRPSACHFFLHIAPSFYHQRRLTLQRTRKYDPHFHILWLDLAQFLVSVQRNQWSVIKSDWAKYLTVTHVYKCLIFH